MKLDYTLQSPEERNELVKQIIKQTPSEQLTEKYLQILSNYIIFAMDKQEKKTKQIITDNRAKTINRNETSYEGLADKFEYNQDAIYNMFIENDKNILLTSKVQITDKDLQNIPGLKDLCDAIKVVKEQYEKASGRLRSQLLTQLIQMYKDQYVLKYQNTPHFVNAVKSMNSISWDEQITVTPDRDVIGSGFSFMDVTVVKAILANYSKIKMNSWDRLGSDAKWALIDFEKIVDEALKDKYPVYYDILIYKIDGRKNDEIHQLLQRKHNTTYTNEYISVLWKNKIPRLIVEQAKIDYLNWYFTYVEYGEWKRCSCCGQIKLAHPFFFSKNNTSVDGYYSLCKQCRSARTKAKKELKRCQKQNLKSPSNKKK